MVQDFFHQQYVVMDFVFQQTLFPIHFQGKNRQGCNHRNRNLNMSNMSHLYGNFGRDLPNVFVHEVWVVNVMTPEEHTREIGHVEMC